MKAIRRSWRLPLILCCQLALTIPWLLNRSVYGDEALYTWAGHIEVSRWLQGRAAPPFGKFFSGLPTLYPPLAALTGSLVGARLISTFFALLATAMLYLAIRRLCGQASALAGCCLFVAIYPTMHVGSYATYDAMALGFLGMAGYFAVRAADDERQWPLLCALAMLLANTAKYATVIYDPVIIGICAFRGKGIRPWLETTAWWAAGGCGLLFLVGKPYIGGIEATTLSRTQGVTPMTDILWAGFKWEWAVLVPAVAVAVWKLARHQWGKDLGLTAVLAGATLLAPLGEARLHTEVSLNKHIAFGAWFGAIAAGYGIGSLLIWLRADAHRLVFMSAAASAIATVGIAGALGARAASATTAESHVGYLVPKLRLLAVHWRQPFILTDSSIPKHELPVIAVPQDWRTIQADKEGQVVVSQRYLASIRDHRFTVIALSFKGRYKYAETVYLRALTATGEYRFAGDVPFSNGVHGYYSLWERSGSSSVYIGAALPNRKDLASFMADTRTHVNIVELYQPFIKLFPTQWAREVSSRGILPVIQINPRHAPLAAIASGKYDNAIRLYASGARQVRTPVVVSFGHEMNGSWYPWGCHHVKGATFITAWRHFVTVMRQAGASNVVWMWTTNVELRHECGISSRWPGAQYVDWVGLDGYLRKPGDTFQRIFSPTIARIRELFVGKPLLIAETGALAGPGQAARIHNLYEGAARARVQGMVYFDGATAKFGDYRPQDNEPTLSAFRQALAAFLKEDHPGNPRLPK